MNIQSVKAEETGISKQKCKDKSEMGLMEIRWPEFI